MAIFSRFPKISWTWRFSFNGSEFKKKGNRVVPRRDREGDSNREIERQDQPDPMEGSKDD